MILVTLDNPIQEENEDKVLQVLEAKCTNGQLERLSSDGNLTTICYSFTSLKSPTLNGLESSLREIAPVQKVNMFFNKQGALF